MFRQSRTIHYEIEWLSKKNESWQLILKNKKKKKKTKKIDEKNSSRRNAGGLKYRSGHCLWIVIFSMLATNWLAVVLLLVLFDESPLLFEAERWWPNDHSSRHRCSTPHPLPRLYCVRLACWFHQHLSASSSPATLSPFRPDEWKQNKKQKQRLGQALERASKLVISRTAQCPAQCPTLLPVRFVTSGSAKTLFTRSSTGLSFVSDRVQTNQLLSVCVCLPGTIDRPIGRKCLDFFPPLWLHSGLWTSDRKCRHQQTNNIPPSFVRSTSLHTHSLVLCITKKCIDFSLDTVFFLFFLFFLLLSTFQISNKNECAEQIVNLFYIKI